MNKKLILILIFIVMCFFTFSSAVCASEEVDNKTLSNEYDILQADFNEDVLNDGITKTFKDLNDLINNANEDDVVELNDDYVFDETKDSSFVQGIRFTKDITIDGKGHTISGNNLARILQVGLGTGNHEPVSNVILKNIHFKNARNTNVVDKNSAFGAVEFYGSGSIINCNFSDNYAYCASAVAIGYGTVTVSGCNFINNTGFGQGGGAIRLKTEVSGLTLYDCFFKENYGNSYGGAVHSDMGKGNKNCVVDKCIFINNTAKIGSGALFFETPGGIVRNSEFYNNSAPIGGAIYWNGVAGDVSTSKFVNNSADNGGAIYFSGRSTSNLTTSTFINNYASQNGGAVYFNGSAGSSIDKCLFIHNTASGDGGAIYCLGEFFKLTDSNFTNDSARNGGSLFLDIGAYVFNCEFIREHANIDGGAIYLYAKLKEGFTFPDNIKLGVFSSNFTSCTAGHDGGAGFVYSDYGVVQDSILKDCTAGHDGGAGYIYGSYGKLLNSQLINNMAVNNGGALYWAGNNGTIVSTSSKSNKALKNGGALYWSGNSGNLTDCNFISNHGVGDNSDGGSVMWIGSQGIIENCQFNISTTKNNGGVAYISGNNTNITKSVFERYNATKGGALYIEGNNIKMSDSSFEYGEATLGGAIYLNGENSYLGNSNLTHNHALTDGGIIYVNGNHGTIADSNLMYSYAEQSGGAFYVNGNYTVISNSNLTYNNASNANGGSIYINGHYTNVTNDLFQYSFAKKGAAIFVEGSNARILNSEFIQNGANPELNIQDTAGGSIFIQGNYTVVNNDYFSRNNGGDGGAIYVNGSNTNITKSIFEYTFAYNNGGAVFIGGINTNIFDSTFKYSNATNGGAIYIKGENNNISANFSYDFAKNGDGGAIYVTGDNNNIINSNFTVTMALNGNGGAVYAGGVNTTITNMFSNIAQAIRQGPGNKGNGGSVYIAGSDAKITKSTFLRYNATDNGGALYVQGNGVNITYSTFEYGEAKLGGSIFINGDNTHLSHSNLTHSHAIQNGGVIYINGNKAEISESNLKYSYSGISGGAVFISGSNNDITNSNLTYNNASSGYGGSVYIEGDNNNITYSLFEFCTSTKGGAIYIDGSNAQILHSNFTQNGINPQLGINENTAGGTIYVAGANAKIEYDNFKRSTAYDGGILYVAGNNAEIKNSNFTMSVAYNKGGAIYISGNSSNICHSIFSLHNATIGGGAIYVVGNNGNITQSHFTITTVNSTSNITSGGAIYVGGNNVGILKSTFNITRAVNGNGGAIFVSGNDATIDGSNFTIGLAIQGNGGSIYIAGENAVISNCISNVSQAIGSLRGPPFAQTEYAGLGGTVYISGNKASIRNSDFKRYNATFRGGSVYITGHDVNITKSAFEYGEAKYGGAIYINGEKTYLSESNLTHNHAAVDGGVIYVNGNNSILSKSRFEYSYANHDGGTIFINGENTTLKDSNLSFNNASSGFGGSIYIKGDNTNISSSLFQYSTSLKGGAVYINGTQTSILKSDFIQNRVTLNIDDADGGTIYIEGDKTLIAESNFTMSNANDGGFIYISGDNTNITKSSFDRSVGYNYGGAIYIGGENTTISESSFARHNATYGGAIYVNGTNARILTSNFTMCNAVDGGAIYVNGHNASVIGCNITKYNATEHGGALFVQGDNVNITQSSFEFGEAQYGGAVFIQGENTYVAESVFTHNHANIDGGIIYINGSNSNLNTSVLSFSYAGNSGGAIYIEGVNTTVNNCNMSFNNATVGEGGSIYVKGVNTKITASDFRFCTSTIGGAIYIDGTNASILTSNFTQNRVSDNHKDGGTIYVAGNNTLISESNFKMSNAYNGGIIYIAGVNTNITKSTFDSSIAFNFGGAIFVGGENTTISESSFARHNATKGGAIYVNGTNARILTSNFTMCNAAVDGGAIYVNGHNAGVIGCNITKYNATEHGGALFIQGDNVNITQSSFEFGEAKYGGAVFIQGENTYVAESVFTHNHANMDGGIIYINGSNANLNNSVLSFSYAANSGGAIYIEGINTVVNNCNMSFNNATRGQGGSIYIKGNYTNITSSDFKFCTSTAGGAIYINGFEALIKLSNFTQNRVSSLTGDGGSIYIEGNQSKILYSDFKMSNSNNGGIIYIKGVNANISSSKFNSSVATNYGGAIYVGGENATIENSTFMRHNATKGGAIYVAGVNAHILTSNFTQCNAKEDGGVIFIQGDNATIIGCIIEKYTATAYGGALYVEGHNANVTNSTFTFGEASYGGAAYIEGENAYIENSTFSRNHAVNDGGIVYIKGNNVKINTSRLSFSYSNQSGGAIYIYGVNATINDCNMSYNNATRGNGGSIYIKGRNATINASDFRFCISTSGGAIYVDGIGARILESNFTSNRVTSGGNGGTVYIAGNETFISKSNFTRSNAKNGGFIYIKGNNANISESSFTYSAVNDDGGALYIEGINASMYSSKFFRNNATRGGAVYINGENTNVVDSNFSQGHAGSGAGAIYLGGVNTYVYKSVFDYNSATSDGGAMYNQGGTAKIWYSNFTNNYVKGSGTVHGGAIYWDGGSLNDLIFGCYFVNNSASHTNNNVDAYGGAIYCGRGDHTTYGAQIRNSTFINNSAARHGGAIYWDLADNGIIDNNTFIKNNVGCDAGAIYAGNDNLGGSNLTISNNHFFMNYAGIRGGAISIQFNSSHIINNTFDSDCSAEGGAVYSRNQKAHNTEIVNCNFTNCTTHAPLQRTATTAHGGAIFLNTELFTIINCRFTDCYTYQGREGGAIYLTDNANNMIIINSTFINCTATQDGNNGYGGAISVHALKFNIYNSSFENCTAVDGGAIYLGRGSNQPDNLYNLNFTSNVATRYGGAIYITENSQRVTLDKAVFNGNNASQGSAIYNNGNGDIYISNIVFGANRADADELIINVNELTYYPNNVNITIFFKGKDNIANAIWNENGVDALNFKNITYQMFKNNKLTNVTLANGNNFVKPKLGAQESSYGENIYQDNIEDAQIINVVITDVTDSENNITVETLTGKYTDIYGNLTKIMNRLSVGKYSIYAEHPQDAYYTGIYSTQNFEVKELLNVTKSPQKTQINRYDLINYTITIKNIGEITVSNITITENLPKGYVIVNFTDKDKWTRDGSVFTYIGSLDPQNTIELIITFNTTESGKFLNNITIESNETLNMTVNATDYVDVRAPNLEVNKTSNITSLDVNQLINYTITIKNTGNTNISDIKVHESFLNGFKVVGYSDGWTYDEETNIFTYNGDKLLIDATLILNITFNATSNGTFSNKINVTSDIGHNVSATADNVTVYNPNMTVVKVANMTSVDVNHLINYTITIKNTGDRNISNIKVYDQIPDGFVVVNKSPKWTYDDANGFVYSDVLKVGETITLNITFNATKPGKYSNTVNVTSNIPQNITNTTADNVTVYNPNMTVIKLVNVTKLDIGDLIKYTIIINNTGDCNLSDIKVYEEIPDGFILKEFSYGWSNTTNNIFKYNNVLTPGDITELVLIFNATRNGTFINNITVSSNRTNNITTSSNQTRVYAPNMTVIKTSNVTGDVYVGDLINFKINITNTGDRNISNIKIVEQIPLELKYVSNSDNWTYDDITKTFTYTKGNLTIGQSIILNITFRAINNGTFKNTVVVTSDMENKTNSSEEITTLPDVKLSVIKTANPSNVSVGDYVNFTITVTNNGLSNATYINVTDKLNQSFELISYGANITGVSITNQSNIVKWIIQKLENNTSAQLWVMVRVLTNGTFTNTVSVNSTQNVTTTSNNTNIIVNPKVNLTVVKTVDVVNATVGGNANFTIIITNNGPSNATNITVTDYLNSAFEYVSSANNITSQSGVALKLSNGTTRVTWTFDKLENGLSIKVWVLVKLLTNGTFTNTAFVNSTENKTNSFNDTNITVKPYVNLTVIKTAEVTNATVGDLVNFTIIVTNNGLSNATGINVTDVLPQGMIYVDSGSNITGLKGSSTTLINGSKVVVWHIDKIIKGTSIKLWLQVNLTINGTFRNTVVVSSNENKTNSTNGTNITVKPDVKLNITKTINVTKANVGDLINFTITVTNNGLSNATGVNVTDKLISLLEFQSAVVSQGNYNNCTGLWSIGNITSGRNVTLTIIAKVIGNGTISNLANVTSNENKTVINTTSDNVTALPVVDLKVNKTVNVTTIVYVGTLVNYTITVTNIGLSNATGVNVIDLLDKRLEFISYKSTRGNYNNKTGVWSIGNLNVGEVLTLNITVRVLVNGTIPNVVNVTGNENDTNLTNNNGTSDNITALPDVKLNITKTVNVTKANVGDMINFTITVTNNGLSNATGVNVTDKLIDLLKFQRYVASQGTYNNLTGLWSIGNISSGANVTLTIFARIISNGTISNLANVTSNENNTVINTTSDNVTALPVVDLKVNKTVNVTSIYVGGLINYTITVTNIGLSNATGVNVTDILDKRLKFISCTATKGTYDNATGIWSIGNLNVGEVLTLNITVRVLVNGTIPNVVNVTGNENDTNLTNNNGTSDNITAFYDVKLNITKSINVTKANVGDMVNFTITVKNTGLSNATGVNVTDKLIDLLKFERYVASIGNYNNVTGLWSIGNLTAGGNATLTIFAKVIGNGTISNVANVTANENNTVINTTSDNVTALPVVDLKVNKTVNLTVVYVGGFVNYTITVTNIGLSNATGVNVTDVLDNRLKFVSFKASRGTYDNVTGVWSIGNLNVGEVLTLNITVRVLVNGTIPNVVNVTGNENDTNLTNNNGTSDNITASPDVKLNITKTVNVTKANVGDVINFTITVTNNGLSNASGVNVTDKLIDSLKFERYVASAGSYNNVTGLWSIGNITSKANVTLTIFARIIANGTISNVANVTSNENKTVINTTSDNVTALPDVRLNITKTVNITNANVGDVINFTITVKNNGLSNATGVNVTDKLIDLLEFIKAIPTQGNYNNVTGLWSVGNITSGKNVTLIIFARIISNGTISNVANVTSNENKTVINTTSDNVTALPVIDLVVNKTVNATQVYVGDLVNFTITVTNVGLSNATGVNVTDLLDKRLAFVSYSSTRGIYYNSTGIWKIGNLNVGEILTLNITAKVLTNGSIPNVVNVTGNENDTNKSNNNGSSENITSLADVKLNITKTVNVTNANVGDVINFTITVKNNGLSNATGVNVTDKLIDLLKFQRYVASQGSYDNTTGLWSVGNITSRNNVTLTIFAKIVSNGTISNVANVTSNENQTVVNVSSDNVTALPVIDLVINKTVNTTLVYVGNFVNFTITVTNSGLSNATGVNVTDLLDKRLEFILYSSTRGIYYNSTGIWEIGNLNVGEVLTLNITAKVLVNGSIPNVVTVCGNENDTNKSNNNASSENITALADVKLNITKTVNVTDAKVGDLVNFTIVVKNNGLSNATGVNVTDKLIGLLEFIKAIPTQGSYNNSTGLWSVGNITSGNNVTLIIIAKILSNGTIANTANVTANENKTLVNSSSDNVTANPFVDLTINKTINTTNAKVNDYVSYTITVKNIGLSNATGVKVTEILDKRLKFINSTGNYDKATGVWTIGNVNSNQTVSLTIVVQVIGNGTIPNIVNVSSTENDTNKSNNIASSDNLTALPVVNITVIKKTNITDDVNISVGDKINFTITITNHGPSNATDIAIMDILDDAFIFISANGTYSKNGQKIIWSIPKLENGSSTSVWVNVEASKNGFYSNSAIVNSTENKTPVSNKTDVVILPAVNISLIKTSNLTSNANVGDLVNFTIVITNNGPSKATNVNVVDVLNETFKLISYGANITDVTITNQSNIVKWNISAINNKGQVELWVVVKVLSNGTFTNIASVNSQENTTGTSNSTTITVNPTVNLTVIKSSDASANVVVGDQITFTINVTNNGPNTATNVVITDVLDSAFKFITASGNYNNESQKITWTIGNLANGSSVCVNVTVQILKTGKFNNTATVNATENGTAGNGTTTVNVTSISTPIKLETQNITYGETENIIVTLPNDATGIVNITVANRTYTNLSINYGVAVLPIDDLAGGEYNVTVKYGGDSRYVSNSTTGKFKVSPRKPIINIEVVDIIVGQIEVLNVTVNAPGTVNVTVNGVTKEISLENGVVTSGLLMATRDFSGKATWNILDLKVGEYPVFAIYNGNENYSSVNTTATFKVNPIETIVKVTANDIYVGENAIINVDVIPNKATGNVTLVIEGKTYTVYLNNGKGQISIPGLSAGLKDVSATYNGDDKYIISKNQTSFNVKKLKPALTISSKDIYVGEDETITVTLPVDVTGSVTITVGGKTYTSDVTNGKASFTVSGLNAGKYVVEASYSGDDKYLPTEDNDQFKVLKLKPDVSVDAPDIEVGQDGEITVTLPSDATGKVTIEIEGKRYTADVINGKAKFNIPGLAAGNHNFKVYYSGDDKYLAVETTSEITVKEYSNYNAGKVNSGVKVHQTGNPLLILLFAIVFTGFTQLRRFKK